MTDWWEVMSDSPDNFNHGVDMNMPGGKHNGPLYIGRNNRCGNSFS